MRPPRSSRWPHLKDLLTLAYALCVGWLSVWVVSFAPTEGPPIAPYLPADAWLVVQTRSATELLRAFCDNSALQAFLNDSDVNEFWAPLARRDELLSKLRQAPALVRWLFPPELASLDPLIGHECVVAGNAGGPQPGSAGVPPASPEENKAESAGETPALPVAGETPALPGTPLLFFTRLSGSRGHLVRLGACFAKLPRNVRFFDIGGGLAALGFNGAEPEWRGLSACADRKAILGKERLSQASTALLLARLTMFPSNAPAPHKRLASAYPQYEQLRAAKLPEAVLRALLQPPGALEMCSLSQPPAEISLDIFSTAQGFAARGNLQGLALPVPATPDAWAAAGSAGVPPASGVELFAEALLPVDLKALFLNYLESEMRLVRDEAALIRGQRRWSHRFSQLREAGVDLDRDLWPALGHKLYLTVSPDPLDVAGYALLRANVPLDGAKAEVRDAAAELIRQRWDGYVFDGPVPPHEKPPYVKLAHDELCDKYVLNTGQLMAPGWIVSRHGLYFTSNAGLNVVRDPSSLREPQARGAASLPAPPGGAPAPCFFLRLDGPRLAPTIERLMTLHFDELEEKMQSGEFLERYPDAALHIRLAVKIACLIGGVKAEVRPETGQDGATVELEWTPSILPAPTAEKAEAAPPRE